MELNCPQCGSENFIVSGPGYICLGKLCNKQFSEEDSEKVRRKQIREMRSYNLELPFEAGN